MPAAIAPAPPKPATPPPAPAPAPTPSPAPAPVETPEVDSFSAELESKFKGFSGPDKLPDKPKEVVPDKVPDKALPKPEVQDQDMFKGANPRLRKEYEKNKGELQTTLDKMKALEAKVSEWEAKGKDTSVLAEQFETLKKEREDLKAENALLRDEPDEAFKNQYITPFETAADRVKVEVEQLVVLKEVNRKVSEDPTTGEAVMEKAVVPDRQATWEDFVALYRLPYVKAIEQAKAMFGDQFDIVKDGIRELKRLDYDRASAETKRRENAKSALAKKSADATANRERIEQARKKVDEDLVSSVDDYRDAPEDKESSQVRQQAYELFDRKPQTMQEAIVKERHTRHIFASNMVKKLQIARLKKELEETKTELDSFKNPQPGAGKRTGSDKDLEPKEDWAAGLKNAVSGA